MTAARACWHAMSLRIHSTVSPGTLRNQTLAPRISPFTT